MDFSEKIDWATGYLTLAIGRGDFRGAVNLILQQAETSGYRRGYSSGQEAAKGNPVEESKVVMFYMGDERVPTYFAEIGRETPWKPGTLVHVSQRFNH